MAGQGVRQAGGNVIRRHLAFMLLLMVLMWHCVQTFGVYVRADDFGWLERSAADAARPWNIFGKPVFGNYCRPVVNAIWLANWYVWGLNLRGYQLSLCLLWLAGIVLVYGVGCRLGGRVAGFTAAALLGLNDIHLLLVTWKSWFTALSEIALMAGWLWCFMVWLERRRRRHLTGWLVLAALGMMAKETAPLIVSGGVFMALVWPRLFRERGEALSEGHGGRRRAALWLTVWAAATVCALLAMPAYRGMIASVLGRGGAQEGTKAFSLAHFTAQFPFHASSIFGRGISRGLLLFAIVMNWWRGLKTRGQAGERPLRVLLGALIIGAVAVSLPAGAAIWDDAGKALAHEWLWPATAGLLFCGFVLTAAAGDKWDRVLAVWFVAAMAAILFFYKKTNAYHMLAFVALAVYVGRACARFAAELVIPAWRRRQGRLTAAAEDGPRLAVTVIFLLVCMHQGWMLGRNFYMLHFGAQVIEKRVALGKTMRAEVQRAVDGVLADPAPDKRVWLARDEWERMAALELRTRHGFKVEDLRKCKGNWIGLRQFDSWLRVYTDAIRFDRQLFASHNGLLRMSAVEGVRGVLRPGDGAPGEGAFEARAPAGQRRNLYNDSPAFGLAPGAAVVFGGFMRNDAAGARGIGMALLSADGKGYAVRTASVHGTKGQWRLVWACAAPTQAAGRLKLRVLEALGVTDGTVSADDVFICPVAPLIRQARASAPASP